MVDGVMLTEKTKEELIEIILAERKKMGELESKIRELEEKIEILPLSRPKLSDFKVGFFEHPTVPISSFF